MLKEFLALTGYHRKSAMRLLRHGYRPPTWTGVDGPASKPRMCRPLLLRSGRPVGTSVPRA